MPAAHGKICRRLSCRLSETRAFLNRPTISWLNVGTCGINRFLTAILRVRLGSLKLGSFLPTPLTTDWDCNVVDAFSGKSNKRVSDLLDAFVYLGPRIYTCGNPFQLTSPLIVLTEQNGYGDSRCLVCLDLPLWKRLIVRSLRAQQTHRSTPQNPDTNNCKQ